MKINNVLLRHQLPALLLGLAILLYAAGFSYLTVTRYAAFEARALDLGNLHQTVWNTANGRPFHMTNQPGTLNRLSLHVEPILLPIAALYWLHDGPETLLILQSIVVALGALPLYALAKFRLRNRWLALILALVYLLNPTIQAANWLEFHPVTLAPTFLMAAVYFLFTKRTGWYVLFTLLAASCKEEIGLLLFMLGSYTWLVLRRPRTGVWTMVLALGWSLFAVLGIQHFFANGNIHWGRYDYLGATPLDKVTTLITQPQLVWQQLQAADALGYLIRLLWPVGFVALLAPEFLLLALPSLAINLLADFPPMHEVYTLIYAAPVLPFVMVAMVEGVKRVTQVAGGRWQVAGGIAILVLCSAGVAQWQHGYLPGGGNYRLYTVTDHDRRAADIIAQIPADAKVSAQDKLDPHVAGRETIYIFPRVDDADTIFVDVTGPAWPQHPNDLYADLQGLLAEDWGIAAGIDGYLLLRKGETTKEPPASFYNAFHRPDLPDQRSSTVSPPQITFEGKLVLLDHEVVRNEHGETVTRLYWQRTDNSPTEDGYRFYVAYADAEGAVQHDTRFYPPVATLWYPTSMWQPGEIVVVETLPWQLDIEKFTLLIGLYRGEEGWDSGNRLPVTAMASKTEGLEPLLLDGGTLVRLDGYRRTPSGWARQTEQITPLATVEGRVVDVTVTTPSAAISLTAIRQSVILTETGGTVEFALAWQTDAPITFDYSLFAHLRNETGDTVAQHDWQPHDPLGPRPMTSWRANEAIWDRQQLTVPSGLPAGNYTVVLGVYNWETNTRLAANGDAVTPGDVVEITQFSVK